MTSRLKHILTIILTTVCFASCNKTVPAGFWKSYQSDYLKKNISDQGPWGGHRAMYWKTDNKNTFAAKQVIDFATKNGWELVDSILFPSDTLGKWKTEHTFPFTYSDFSDTTMNMEAFPRWIMSEVEVYRFKTGWIAVEPGNARETDKNGYVTINSDGTELSVYHLWGE